MNKPILIALSLSAGLGLAACAGDETATAEGETVETSADDAYGAAPEMPADPLAEDTAPMADADDGSRLSVDPEGAELDIREGNVDANVSTEGDSSLEVEF
ncbi:hypothetical protein HFP57_17280 [Parasphingopyxis algicola]|uniref:hypothetical protein n=1 Tax=Parasphingopyxis algicola TaxID=2026624 RepID=UPI0015A285CD|nr:hypothetical protein [Parasphingopyxis algicola]QLC26614.1 hypothetical protein HFP57_17280 [Parasphingopyxis algicola]